MRKFLMLVVFCALTAGGAYGQTVLFDGLTHENNRPSFLLAPAVVTGDSYGAFGRLTFRAAPRFNLFLQSGGEFNGGATAVPGIGWSGTFVRESGNFPLNFGFFNSINFPLRSGGPDALITLAPVFSRSFERTDGRITPYGGVTATLKVNAPGTDVNALLGMKIAPIGPRWDFIAEVQAGERSQFALGFFYRF